LLDYLTNFGEQNISVVALCFSIILATIISLIAGWVYKFTHRGMIYERSFMITLLMMGPIIALIITVIGNNIALSIGLVGSLSIIRFRTVIKDSRDLIYLLWGIAIGLGSGTNNWFAIVAASAILAIILLIVHIFRYGYYTEKNFVLVIGGTNKDIELNIKKILIKNQFNFSIRSMDKTSDNNWQVVFEIIAKEGDKIDKQKLMEQIENVSNINNVSLLAPNITLPI